MPEFAEKQYRFPMLGLTKKAMNYFDFNESIYVEGTFFISVVLANSQDSISLYQSNGRTLPNHNTMIVNDNGKWNTIDNYSDDFLGSSLLLETTMCNLSLIADTVYEDNSKIKVYPNPVRHYLTVEFKERRSKNDIKIYDRVGHLVYQKRIEDRMYVDLNISNLPPGIYFISYASEELRDMKRFLVY